MVGSKSGYWESSVLDFCFNHTGTAVPLGVGDLHIALYESNIGNTNTAGPGETDYTDYAREQVDPGSTNWSITSNAADHLVKNKLPITFTANGEVTTAVLTGAALVSTGTLGVGDIYYYDNFGATVPIETNQQPTLAMDAIQITET